MSTDCRDTAVLCESLTYEQGLPHILDGEEIQQYTSVYTPPFDEFEVFKVDMPATASTLVPANQVPMLLHCLPLAETTPTQHQAWRPCICHRMPDGAFVQGGHMMSPRRLATDKRSLRKS